MCSWRCSGDSADNKVQLQGRPQGKMNISNVFTIIPDDFVVVAELTIEKKVLDQNGQQNNNKIRSMLLSTSRQVQTIM